MALVLDMGQFMHETKTSDFARVLKGDFVENTKINPHKSDKDQSTNRIGFVLQPENFNFQHSNDGNLKESLRCKKILTSGRKRCQLISQKVDEDLPYLIR